MSNKTSNVGCVGCIAYIFGWAIVMVPLSFWTDRNLDFWLTYFKGETVDCPLWLSFVTSILSPIAVFLNLVGEIARLAV